MTISILTLFPDIIKTSVNYSILQRAQKKKLVDFKIVNIRDFALDKHKSVDDHPYGGGPGMILRVDIIDKALSYAKSQLSTINYKLSTKMVLLDARGKAWDQKKALEFSHLEHLILICGHYEGVDERAFDLVDEVISIGDFILTGGEIPALALTDSIVRLIPGVLEKKEAVIDESFSSGLLSFPQYTKPTIHNKKSVPEVLLSGNHQKISSWRKEKSVQITKKFRPDLLK